MPFKTLHWAVCACLEKRILHKAAKCGLSEEIVLRAVTLSAAEILKIEDRVGGIESGKDADLILLDGEPLDIMTHVKAVFIDGKIVFKEKDVL